ncbi:MAG: hypothetical protein WCJ30_06240 [Deltaproteobacteria bacterium]
MSRPATSPRRRPRFWRVVIAVSSLSCLVYAGWYALEARRHPSMSEISVACDGRPSAVAIHATHGAIPRRVAWLERREGRWRAPFHDPLGNDWRAEWADEAQLVVCAEPPVEQIVERCPLGTGRVVERVRRQQTVRLVAGATGEVLARETLAGAMPEPCSANEPLTSGAEVARLEGADVSDATVRAFLRPYVTRIGRAGGPR